MLSFFLSQCCLPPVIEFKLTIKSSLPSAHQNPSSVLPFPSTRRQPIGKQHRMTSFKMAATEAVASTSRLGICRVCSENNARYTCPECSLTTCSLPCVKKHKEDFGCTGQRNKTAYVALGNFTDLNLLSDYRLLEETARCISNASRNPLSRGFHPYRQHLPYWLHRLKMECKRRQINLKIMPQHFTRHKNNKTHFASSQQKIFWQVEWKFPQANVSYTEHRLPEDIEVSRLLEKYLDPVKSSEEVKQKLLYYQAAGYKEIVLLMKIEESPADAVQFSELNISKSLQSNLKGKSVLEYPTILVVMREHAHIYPVLVQDESDDDDDEEHENGSTSDLNRRVNYEDDDNCDVLSGVAESMFVDPLSAILAT